MLIWSKETKHMPVVTASPVITDIPEGVASLTSDTSRLSTVVPASATPTLLPVPQVIPTISRQFHGIDTLIGLNHMFRIHRAAQGETLEILAIRDSTTVAALHAVNYKLSIPIRPRQMIVIPVFQKDVSDLPEFEAYRVVEDTTLENLSIELDVDVEALKLYNGLRFEQYVYHGEWLVVPRGEPGAE